MDISEKLAKIQSYKETDFQEKVLMPLLIAMGHPTARMHHGSREKGKDIVFWKEDELGDRVWYALVVKTTNITAKVSNTKSSIFQVCNQIEQVFDSPYIHPRDSSEVRIAKCWVVTSRKITKEAAESALDRLRKNNLDKFVKFLSGEDVVELLDKHARGFFEEEKPVRQYAQGAFSKAGEILEPKYPGVRAEIQLLGQVVAASGVEGLDKKLLSGVSSAPMASGISERELFNALEKGKELIKGNFPPEDYNKLSSALSQAEEDYEKGCQSSCETDVGPFSPE